MSRRPPNLAAEKAAQNQQTIKALLKLEPNKLCADCKRNKHPRWASWNLGVFVCIRCSGIHRGMGTHISRVKSVDLDSWTDEQLQSILSWGNARAKKYWEAKLDPGHVPSEAKIENFIRTKYELKRWVMDGGIPDPSTLDADGDDEVPLSLVKEKQTIERKESIRKQSAGQASKPAQADLMGGDPVPARASTAGPTAQKVAPKAAPAPPKASASSNKDSLLGLDFFGDQSAAPPRPASTASAGAMGGQSRPDLKQSILSLYASAPKPQPQPQPQQHSQPPGGSSFGAPSQGHQPQKSVGGLDDAFGSLSFASPPAKQTPAADPFASFGSPSISPKPTQASSSSAFGGLGGGNFFDSKPAQPAHQKQVSTGSFGGFGDFASPSQAPAPAPAPVSKPAQPASSSFGDLFDLSSPAPQTTAPPPSKPAPPQQSSSVFNLSSPQPKSPAPTSSMAPMSSPMTTNTSSGWGNDDWGNAWSQPDPKPVTSQPQVSAASKAAPPNDFGWGGSGLASPNSLASQSIVPGASGGFGAAPKVAADEEFGGWASSTTPASGSSKPAGGFGGNDDLFSNVWQ